MSATAASASTTTRFRPQTHKPRGICRYYNVSRGCFAGNKCKFLHGVPSSTEGGVLGNAWHVPSQQEPLLTPYDQAKHCRYFTSGFCKRGDECWFKHVLEPSSSSNGKEKCPMVDEGSDSEAESLCSICYEKPSTYGLLSGCNHIFCISCIREWRDRKSKSTDLVSSGNNKKCPMCRESSNFITPSSAFIKHGTEEKEFIIGKYKESMGKVQCRYFERTKGQQPTCPFGKDCFYKHEKADGTIYDFREGASVWMRRHGQRRRPNNNTFVFADSDSDDARYFGFPFGTPLLDLFNPAMALSSIGRRLRPAGTRPALQAALANTEVTMGRIPSGPRSTSQLDRPFPQRDQAEPGPAGGGRRQLSSDTVQDIGRSLEVLNDAMNTGATLDRISGTVQRLQERLRQEANEAAEDGESIERLQNLADQMLASIEILQTASARSVNPFSRSPTPDQPLPHPFSSSRSRTQATRPVQFAEVASDDDMPELQSISNSSEEEYESLDDSDGTSDDENDAGFGAAPDWEEALLSHFTRRPSTWAPDTSTPADADADGPPPLIPISETQSSIGLDPLVPAPDDVPTLPVSMAPSSPPPFVTDGRGRVVWTSTDSAPSLEAPDSPGPSGTLATVPPEETPLPTRAPTSPTASHTRSSGSAPSPSKSLANPTIVGPSEVTTGGRGRVVAVPPHDESEPVSDVPPQGVRERSEGELCVSNASAWLRDSCS